MNRKDLQNAIAEKNKIALSVACATRIQLFTKRPSHHQSIPSIKPSHRPKHTMDHAKQNSKPDSQITTPPSNTKAKLHQPNYLNIIGPTKNRIFNQSSDGTLKQKHLNTNAVPGNAICAPPKKL